MDKADRPMPASVAHAVAADFAGCQTSPWAV